MKCVDCDSEPKQYRSLIADLTLLSAKWRRLLLLDEWHEVSYAFLATAHDDADTCALTSAYWQYRRAKVEWFLPKLMQFDLDGLENVVVHEHVHVLLGPLAERLKPGSGDFEELAVESVARALIATHKETA